MNTQEEVRSFTPDTPAATAAFNIGRKALALALAYLMVPLGIGDVYAQTAPPPPPDQGQYQGQYQDQAPPPPDQGQYQGQYGQDQNGNYDQGPPPQDYNVLSPAELERLVAPIALYPDALIAQVLAASTYPDEIVAADNFVRANQGLPPNEIADMVNDTNWDPSVKSLVAFPSVLENMDRNMDWTSQLGNAYYNQPQDVMNAIQDMRARAYAAGNLRSDPRLVVEYNPGYIVIAPANPNVYYVPWYNPWVVYGAPVVAWGGYYPPPRPVGYYVAVGVAIGFGIGIAVASWNHYGWGCHHWGMGWRDRTVVYQQNIYISRSVHVVNHGYYGHFDRDRDARRHNMQIARRAPNFHPAGNRRPDTFNPQTRRFVPQQNRNFGRPQQFNRPGNLARPAQQNRDQFNRNQNFNRPQQNRNFNRPQNNTRPAQQNRGQFNRNQNFNRPQEQNRQQYNRPQQFNRPQNQPQNFNRPPQQNREQFNRPQQQRPQNFNRPQERPQQFNRPQQSQNFNRPQQQRPQSFNRPQQQRPQQFNRQQQRPQERSQPRPQQSRPENHGHAQHENHGHRR